MSISDTRLSPLLPETTADRASPVLVESRLEQRSCSLYQGLALGGTTLVSCAGLTISATFLIPIITEIANRCFDAQILSQAAFNQCYAPYVPKLATCSTALAVSSATLGYLIQKALTSHMNPSKHTALFIQKKFRSEILIAVNCIYNGLFIPVTDPPSFLSVLHSVSAGIALASVCFGVYLRNQQIRCKQEFPIQSLSPVKVMVLGGLGATSLIVSNAIDGIPQSISVFILAIGVLLLTRLCGEGFTHLVDRHKIRSLGALLEMQSLIAMGGGLLYSISSSLPGQLGGMGMIGIAQGAKASRFSSQVWLEKPTSWKISEFAKQHWGTALLACFAITSEITKLFDCDGPPSPSNFTCPIGWELSLYLFGNQIVLSSTGVNIALGSALTTYYTRKAARKLCSGSSEKIQKIAKIFLTSLNHLNFSLLSLLPIMTVQSGGGVSPEFYVYDPLIPLLATGIVLGNYKEESGRQSLIEEKKNSDPTLVSF